LLIATATNSKRFSLFKTQLTFPYHLKKLQV
jgi:hypothetical protein